MMYDVERVLSNSDSNGDHAKMQLQQNAKRRNITAASAQRRRQIDRSSFLGGIAKTTLKLYFVSSHSYYTININMLYLGVTFSSVMVLVVVVVAVDCDPKQFST